MKQTLRNTIMMSCERATELAEQRQVQDMTMLEVIGYRIHIWACGICKLYIQQIALIDRLAQAWGKREQPASLTAEQKASMERIIADKLK
jgi:hypothetical protein